MAPTGKTIWVAGHRGMVGQALLRRLSGTGHRVLHVDRAALDLRDQPATHAWIDHHKPDVILLAAATVGGIEANRTRPAEFLYNNAMIAANVIDSAYRCGVGRLVYLGSSCVYPRDASQPISESALMTGLLEPTNQSYALAKITGIALCQSYRHQYGCRFVSAMPCNLYGPGDRFDRVSSHVIPALILKIDDAMRRGDTSVTLWGTGSPLREFLHVDDLARAVMMVMDEYDDDMPMNIGSSAELSISALAGMIARIMGYRGQILFDPSMPDGTPRKILDSSRMRAMGWRPEIDLESGLRQMIDDYRAMTRNAA